MGQWLVKFSFVQNFDIIFLSILSSETFSENRLIITLYTVYWYTAELQACLVWDAACTADMLQLNTISQIMA